METETPPIATIPPKAAKRRSSVSVFSAPPPPPSKVKNLRNGEGLNKDRKDITELEIAVDKINGAIEVKIARTICFYDLIRVTSICVAAIT